MSGQLMAALARLGALKSGVQAMTRRVSRRAVLTLVMGFLWLTAFGFALTCLTLWLAGVLGATAAFGIVAALLAIAAAAIHLGMVLNANAGRSASAAAAPFAGLAGAQANAKEPAEPMSDEAVIGSVAAVSLAGYLLGRMVRQP